jgi:hypothetical protein
LRASATRRTPQPKSARRIGTLLFVSLCQRPSHIPQQKRARGSKARGLAYEKRVARELRTRLGLPFTFHQWIKFHETNGDQGYAEPEGWFELADEIILVECKLTGVQYGHEQMLHTYKPLLEWHFKKPVRCLMICRGVLPNTPGPFVDSIEDFIQSGLPLATWHFLL